MIRPDFLSPAERLELKARVRSHRGNYGIAQRANAILLLEGAPVTCKVTWSRDNPPGN